MAFPKLLLSNITKVYPHAQQLVLDTVSFHVNKGEFVSIIGPSGCGKSTLFHLISGIESQTTGDISFAGEKIRERKGKVGYMFQNSLLLPWRTVLNNLLLGTDIRHIPRTLARKQAVTMLEKFGLASYMHAYPAILSGGMKQRVALLRTMLFHQDLLLLDEPFGALDALTRLSCQLWLLEVWKQVRSSIVFITHDIREAILLSDRIYVMSKRPGRIIGEFSVGLQRPRKPEALQSRQAIMLEKKLFTLLAHEQV
ncbi:MAG: ABC transporter ATP-binding protein [Patescibacteria group bacterium]|nr:ABC transporter ATP-binding protein [Patescibacteria group bacterium]